MLDGDNSSCGSSLVFVKYENDCKGHADVNFNALRKIALVMLKNETSNKVGIKNKRLTAGRNDDYLLKVLVGE